MAFIVCPNCGATFSEVAYSCLHCGYSVGQNGVNVPPSITTQPEVSAEPITVLPPFFAVPVVKLAILSFCTFGLYEFFWFYRHWQRARVREQVDISPFWRAFFGVIFCYSCFARIRTYGTQLGITPAPQIGLLAGGWILTTLTWRLPGPFWLISLFSFIFLLPVQAYANRINSADSPAHDPNSRFGIWNWVGVVAGSIVLLLDIVALFVPTRS
jgi:hypothetical protein